LNRPVSDKAASLGRLLTAFGGCKNDMNNVACKDS